METTLERLKSSILYHVNNYGTNHYIELCVGDQVRDLFPSPCGVNIVANIFPILHTPKVSLNLFPSPCGVNIVANGIDNLRRVEANKGVSVPLRGKYRGE